MARPDSPGVIYLDSNTLCRFIIGKDVETVGRVIEAVDAGGAELIVSPLLLVECRGQPRSGPIDKELEHRLLGILDMTTDKGFPLETEVDGVWVGKPYYWGPATLFDDRDG